MAAFPFTPVIRLAFFIKFQYHYFIVSLFSSYFEKLLYLCHELKSFTLQRYNKFAV